MQRAPKFTIIWSSSCLNMIFGKKLDFRKKKRNGIVGQNGPARLNKTRREHVKGV